MTVSDVCPVEGDPAVADVSATAIAGVTAIAGISAVAGVPVVAGVLAVTAWRLCWCGLPYFASMLLASQVLLTSLMLAL